MGCGSGVNIANRFWGRGTCDTFGSQRYGEEMQKLITENEELKKTEKLLTDRVNDYSEKYPFSRYLEMSLE